jgi:hypothetical protein
MGFLALSRVANAFDRFSLAPCPALGALQAAQKSCPLPKKELANPRKIHIFRIAQIARACGRVSVDGVPDKRPVNLP